SPMDCAKGIGLAAANGRDVLDFEGLDQVPEPGPPLLCVPTTSGTGADVSQFAIINDSARKVKIAIVSKKAIPDAALVDPLVTVSMPPELTAATGMDALVHAMEAYVSTAASALTDLDALEAVRLVGANLPGAVADGGDLAKRSGMTLASLLAGRAFSNASLGVVHAMAHALGGALDLPHGVCNALLLEAAVAANYEAVPRRYADLESALAEGLGERPGGKLDSLLALIRRLKSAVGLDYGLARLGLDAKDVGSLAGYALRDACLVTNPRGFDRSGLEAIYVRAL
ncbi:MAG: iron-containing alcohol dehydrogenase, partial [Spirochaetaceae bacterium]|nr:iron-containing alcohol dehydrogenase [Spirochaetaceae bacterium]